MRSNALALALMTLLLSACGTSATDSVASSPAAASTAPVAATADGLVRLVFTGLEDGKGAGSLAACKLQYTLYNGAPAALKHVSVMLRPVAAADDANANAFIETRGDLVISMANIDAGAERSSDRSFDAMSCDRVKAIRIASKTCGLKPTGSCNEQLVIENETALPLE